MCSRCVASVLFGTQCFVFSSFVNMSMHDNAVKCSETGVIHAMMISFFKFHVPETCDFMLFGTNVFPFLIPS